MTNVDVNYAAILVAAAATMALGFIWYARPVFGDAWMKLLGKKPADFNNPTLAMVASFLGALIAAYVMAHIVGWAGSLNAVDGAMVGLVVGIGIVAMAFVTDYMFAQAPRKLLIINAGYQTLNLVVMGAILGGWQ